MALQLAAYIYGANSNDWGHPKSMSFPTQGITLQAISPAVSYGGVACNTQIQLLPTAPSVIQPVFYTPALIGALVTASNS
jgi:hypothetical protein